MSVPVDPGTLAPDTVWKEVVSQLSSEITQVIAVQQFFTQLTTFHQGLSQAQALLVSELITACAFPNGQATPIAPRKKKRAWLWDMVEGILYTGLNIAGTFVVDPDAGKQTRSAIGALKVNAAPVLANTLSCSLTTYQAHNQSSSSSSSQISKALQNAYSYELTVFQLQQSLLNLFEQIGSMLGKMEMAILVNWGKINAVYTMIKNTSTIESLYWPASMSPVMTQQMLSGYATTVLQTLIPANPNFYINAYLHGYSLSQEGLQEDQLTFYGRNLDNTTSKWVAVINDDVMSQVWQYGTDPNNFYRQLSGWNTLVKFPFVLGSCASLIMNFYNETSVPMMLDVSDMHQSLNNPTVMELPPYGVAQFAGYAVTMSAGNYGATGVINIYEKNLAADGCRIPVLTDTIQSDFSHTAPYYTTGIVFSLPYFMISGYKNSDNPTTYDIHIGMNAT
ncbi:hypothetical protein [Pedobacter sp. R-06]|uniref:hypothetical protein n=1 Tax=Pedobacter sp. R-06 TaxID=3404051 RepID=UPI003CF0336D